MPSIIQIYFFFKSVFGNTDAVLLHNYAMKGKVQNNGVILKVLLVQSMSLTEFVQSIRMLMCFS